nr:MULTISPECIES: TetR/AcrR family transcriptional regulator [unclassified Thermoactinomyces]
MGSGGTVNDADAIRSRSERRDAAENRQRILKAAIRLFEQYGVEQVSMNQIATEAKIGSGTLYRRYRNKGEICLDLIKDQICLLFEDIEAYLQENGTEPPDRRLKGILGLFIRFREKKAQLLKGVENFATAKPPRYRMQNPLYNQMHEILVRLFDEMAENKQSQPDSVFRADLLLTALSSDSYLFQRDVRGHSPEKILEQLCLTFITPE